MRNHRKETDTLKREIEGLELEKQDKETQLQCALKDRKRNNFKKNNLKKDY